MKTLISILILSIAITMNLHSQWLEKEGYWELEQNYGQLHDIKLNESTNELWIVTADNNVIAIDAETGLEKKRCECELERKSEGAKISSDFQSVGFVSSFSKYTNVYDTLYYDYFNISNCSTVFSHKEGLIHLINKGGINGIEFSFFDYISESQNLIISFKINNLQYQAAHDLNDEYGYTKQFNFIDNQLILADSINIPFANVRYYDNKTKFFSTTTMSHNDSWSNWGGGWNFSIHNIIYEYDILNKIIDTLFYHIYGENSKGEKRGHDIHLSKIEETDNQKFYVLSKSTMYEYKKGDDWFFDSLKFIYPVNDFLVSQNNENVLVSTNKSVEAYNFKQKKILESYELPSPVLSLILDSQKKNLLLYSADNKIRYINPDILKPIPELGFIFDKSLVHTGEKIQFIAICNMDSCEYEWQFIPAGNITKTKSKEIEYEYSQPGTYDVKLTIITPEGVRHEFLKENIIKVIDKPKADFSYEILNDELPLKVKFTDLSKGEIIERFWDFGDGNTSTELNPTHEYNFNGDFSVKLIVKDTLGADTLMKYEEIIIHIEIPIISKYTLQKNLAKRTSEFKMIYTLEDGFLLHTYYYTTKPHQSNPNGTMYSLFIEMEKYDYDLNNQPKIVIGCGGEAEYPFVDKPSYIGTKYNDSSFIIEHQYEDYNSKNIWNLNSNTFINILKSSSLKIFTKFISVDRFKNIYWFFDNNQKASIYTTNEKYEKTNELQLPSSSKQYWIDTTEFNFKILVKKGDDNYRYLSVDYSLLLREESKVNVPMNTDILGIKSVNENLILLHGSVEDKVNNTTYAYFGKYHPVDNTLQDTILYSRKDIRKIERVNNSTYIAIGQSRGRQGYLLLDTNLHQIKDIRVDSLTGEIKDMLLHDNKVYLFTEKIVSLETMALGAKESYQTTASVLALPEDIIADVKENPVVTGKTLTHSLYPNPASDVFNLKVVPENDGKYSIKLYDILGVEIFSIYDGVINAGTEKIFSIPTSSLSIGSYYYVISGGSIAERGKVMVVR